MLWTTPVLWQVGIGFLARRTRNNASPPPDPHGVHAVSNFSSNNFTENRQPVSAFTNPLYSIGPSVTVADDVNAGKPGRTAVNNPTYSIDPSVVVVDANATDVGDDNDMYLNVQNASRAIDDPVHCIELAAAGDTHTDTNAGDDV